ncbi:MAG: hypothetical protein HOP11_07470 [Saprospiraceae bacterium]|nr:hypothetical protein [Saprospiraceae bacterium]
MKKLIFFVLLGSVLSIGTISAQCSHGAKKSCSKSAEASASTDPAYVMAASEAATKDASIEKRVCEKSGKVCFYKNTQDATGSTVSTEVTFDQATATFVNATPATESKKACCSSKKACCAKGAKSCSKEKEVKTENKIMN